MCIILCHSHQCSGTFQFPIFTTISVLRVIKYTIFYSLRLQSYDSLSLRSKDLIKLLFQICQNGECSQSICTRHNLIPCRPSPNNPCEIHCQTPKRPGTYVDLGRWDHLETKRSLPILIGLCSPTYTPIHIKLTIVLVTWYSIPIPIHVLQSLC